MKKLSFQENLLRKIELERLADRVVASCRNEPARQAVDKEAMRSLLELSPYRYQRERDLDIYVKTAGEEELKMILVLDNELPIFRSTVKDVVTRRSPRTLEMWNFRTIRKILVDSDIKVSSREKSVETVLGDAIAQLDLSYTDKDIENLAREGMAWLAGRDSANVKKSLSLFGILLGYKEPPEELGLDHTICYGISAPESDNGGSFGPLVLYRPAENALLWINESLSLSDAQQMEFFRSVAAGEASAPVTGDAVFEKLQANVLQQPGRVLRV